VESFARARFATSCDIGQLPPPRFFCCRTLLRSWRLRIIRMTPAEAAHCPRTDMSRASGLPCFRRKLSDELTHGIERTIDDVIAGDCGGVLGRAGVTGSCTRNVILNSLYIVLPSHHVGRNGIQIALYAQRCEINSHHQVQPTNPTK
jgi:hypothetical protein